MIEQIEQLCPSCGCFSDTDAYEKSGILYCCEPCAVEDECGCGCWDEEEEEW